MTSIRGRTKQEKIELLDQALELRESGLDIKDCYEYIGVTRDTFYKWSRQYDYKRLLDQAWLKYKRSLIKQTKKRNSTYLLQNDFKDRFKPIIDKVENTNNTLNIFKQYNLSSSSRINELESKLKQLE